MDNQNIWRVLPGGMLIPWLVMAIRGVLGMIGDINTAADTVALVQNTGWKINWELIYQWMAMGGVMWLIVANWDLILERRKRTIAKDEAEKQARALDEENAALEVDQATLSLYMALLYLAKRSVLRVTESEFLRDPNQHKKAIIGAAARDLIKLFGRPSVSGRPCRIPADEVKELDFRIRGKMELAFYDARGKRRHPQIYRYHSHRR